MAKRLSMLAALHGVGGAEELAKRWLAERITYELELVEKARQQAG